MSRSPSVKVYFFNAYVIYSSLLSNQGTVMQTDSQDKQRKAMGEFSDQVSPPIAWSSPANSPLPSTVIQSSSDGQQLETREFLLSDYPPGVNENMHPLSESAVELNSRDSPVPPRPPSHDSAATRNAAFARKCWDVDVGVKASPVPLTRPDSTAGSEDIKQGTALSEGCITKELEEENHSSVKKGLAMFIGDDHNVGSQVNMGSSFHTNCSFALRLLFVRSCTYRSRAQFSAVEWFRTIPTISCCCFPLLVPPVIFFAKLF